MDTAQDTIKLLLKLNLFVMFCIGAYHRWQAHKGGDKFDRRLEGPVMIYIRLAGLGIAIAVWAAFTSQEWHAPFTFSASLIINWAGLVLTVMATTWLSWMFRSLGANITDTVETRASAKFVNQGPYHYVRNPMYVGILALTIGLGLALNSWLVPITGTIIFTLLAIRTRTEERFLVARFGETYEVYMRNVPRFFPGFPGFLGAKPTPKMP